MHYEMNPADSSTVKPKKEIVAVPSSGRLAVAVAILAICMAAVGVGQAADDASTLITAMAADEGVPQNLVTAMAADDGVPHNLVTAMAEDEGVPHNLVTAMAADDGVPHNLATAMAADEGVPHNLVTAMAADEGVPQNLVTATAAEEGPFKMRLALQRIEGASNDLLNT